MLLFSNAENVSLIGTILSEPHTTLDKFTIFNENNSTAPFFLSGVMMSKSVVCEMRMSPTLNTVALSVAIL